VPERPSHFRRTPLKPAPSKPPKRPVAVSAELDVLVNNRAQPFENVEETSSRDGSHDDINVRRHTGRDEGGAEDMKSGGASSMIGSAVGARVLVPGLVPTRHEGSRKMFTQGLSREARAGNQVNKPSSGPIDTRLNPRGRVGGPSEGRHRARRYGMLKSSRVGAFVAGRSPVHYRVESDRGWRNECCGLRRVRRRPTDDRTVEAKTKLFPRSLRHAVHKRDYAAAEKFWHLTNIQHSEHIAPVVRACRSHSELPPTSI